MQTGRLGKEGLRSSLMLLRDQSDERHDRGPYPLRQSARNGFVDSRLRAAGAR